jgi:hypothetical protein
MPEGFHLPDAVDDPYARALDQAALLRCGGITDLVDPELDLDRLVAAFAAPPAAD